MACLALLIEAIVTFWRLQIQCPFPTDHQLSVTVEWMDT